MSRFRAFTFDHRRPLAAALTALAVLAALRSLQPTEPSVDMIVAARDLGSGQVVAVRDVRTVRVPPRLVPSRVLERQTAIGRRVSAPLRRGEALTDRRVIDPRNLSGHGPDAALSMVRVADPSSLVGVRVGDRVDVVATVPGEKSQVVASGATLAIVPRSDDRELASVGVVTTADEAITLASAGVDAQLTILVTA